MSAAVVGKVVTLTGTFTGRQRAEAESELAALGAVISKSLTRKTQLLIYGDKAGSKLAQAQSYGIEVRDEAWLMAVLAGGDGSAAARPTLTGPLADYIDRLDAYAAGLRANPALRVGYYRAPGASPERLDRLAQAWGLTSFSPAIRNLYQQADGLCLFWADTNSPEYGERWDVSRHDLGYFHGLAHGALPMMERAPRPYEVESFPWSTGGIIWVLPAASAFKRDAGFFDFAYKVIPDDDTREAYGRTWRGEALERAIRVFDASLQYYPIGFLMDPPRADPPVLIGDDHGAAWTDSRHASFEDYMEGMLDAHFTSAARRQLVMGHRQVAIHAFQRPAPVPIASLLHAPPAPAAVEGGNFSLKVESVGPCSKLEARALLLQPPLWFQFDRLKAILGMTHDADDRSGFALALAAATAELKPLTASAVGKLCTALGADGKTKKALGEKLLVDLEGPLERARVVLTTRFDLADYGHRGRALLEGVVGTAATMVVREQFGDAVVGQCMGPPSGQDALVITIDVLLSPGHGLRVGDTRSSMIAPRRP